MLTSDLGKMIDFTSTRWPNCQVGDQHLYISAVAIAYFQFGSTKLDQFLDNEIYSDPLLLILRRLSYEHFSSNMKSTWFV